MTLVDVYNALQGLGVPVAYSHFEGTPPGVPFVVYYASSNNDIIADDTNYVKVTEVTVELYCKVKDLLLEARLEAALSALDLVYDKTEVWIKPEHCFEISYEMEVL